MGDIAEQFSELGYFDSRQVLSKTECARFLRAADAQRRYALDWSKGLAPTSRVYYEIATLPEILDPVSELLGGDVILWGVDLLARGPGVTHPWHSDIESSDPAARTVSVWLGLQNTTSASSLIVLPYSHRFGITVQQARQERGRGRSEATAEEVGRWARELDERSALVTASVTDGEAVFFDGRLWHGTDNRSQHTRRALLLQYASPDTPIRIPMADHLDWPFGQLGSPLPPCLIVRGSAKPGVNRFVTAPVAGDGAGRGVELTSRIEPLRLPLATDEESGWRRHRMFSGATASMRDFACHASTLLPGRSPHSPHTHGEEELLLLLEGEAELVFSEHDHASIGPGEFVYYPLDSPHTIRATGSGPATYLMLKWSGERTPGGSTLPFGRYAATGPAGRVFEGPTAYLRRLHSHVTVLEPGDGYEPHVDAYDVAIVVLEGEVETLGGRARPFDVIFYRAGEPHGMRNPGDSPARYVVFEFDGRTNLAGDEPGRAARAMKQLRDPRLRDPRRWARRLRRLVRPARP